MSCTFTDKNGVEIAPGMILRHDNGDTEKVYETIDAFGQNSLGFLASNPAFLQHHPDWEPEYYGLEQFNLKEWTVVES